MEMDSQQLVDAEERKRADIARRQNTLEDAGGRAGRRLAKYGTKAAGMAGEAAARVGVKGAGEVASTAASGVAAATVVGAPAAPVIKGVGSAASSAASAAAGTGARVGRLTAEKLAAKAGEELGRRAGSMAGQAATAKQRADLRHLQAQRAAAEQAEAAAQRDAGDELERKVKQLGKAAVGAAGTVATTAFMTALPFLLVPMILFGLFAGLLLVVIISAVALDLI